MELDDVMNKYIKDCDMLKKYHIDPNEMPSEAAKITNVITRKEEIRSINDVDQKNRVTKSKRSRVQK